MAHNKKSMFPRTEKHFSPDDMMKNLAHFRPDDYILAEDDNKRNYLIVLNLDAFIDLLTIPCYDENGTEKNLASMVMKRGCINVFFKRSNVTALFPRNRIEDDAFITECYCRLMESYIPRMNLYHDFWHMMRCAFISAVDNVLKEECGWMFQKVMRKDENGNRYADYIPMTAYTGITVGQDAEEADNDLYDMILSNVHSDPTANRSVMNVVLESLNDAERRLYEMRIVQGIGLQACADAFHCTPNTVKAGIKRIAEKVLGMVPEPKKAGRPKKQK